MKAENSAQPKPNTIKTTTKHLNDKKSTVNSQVQQIKEENKKNLIMKSPVHIASRNQNVRSPKNFQSQQSTLQIKDDVIIQTVKGEKVDIKKMVVSQKSKKSLHIQKLQPLKKQNIPSLKSPRSSKVLVIQSQTNINSQNHQGNQQQNLIVLQTSIIQSLTQQYINKSLINSNSNSNILSQTQIKQKKQIQQIKLTNQQIKLTKTSNLEEIKQLRKENQQLRRKYQKLKNSHQQGRKKLRDRISSFNQEGDQIINLKNKINQMESLNLMLQQKIHSQAITISSHYSTNNQPIDYQQNHKQNAVSQFHTKIQINKIQNNRIQQQLFSIKIQGFISQSEGALSSINGNNSSQGFQASISQEKQKSQGDAQNILPAFQIQLIKSSFELKYQDKLSKIQQIYDQNLKDVQSRYKLLHSQIKKIAIQQQNQISLLQKTIDNFYEQTQNCTCSIKSHKLTIQTSEQQLRKRVYMNETKQKLNQKDEIIKKCRQQFRTKQLQCKRVLSQLDVQRIKYNLKSQVLITHKELQFTAEKQQNQLLKQELKQLKQQKLKLLHQNSKKQQLIKKFSTQQNAKKIRK